MKIFVRDDNDRKITHNLIDHWEKQGHEVHQDMYPDFDIIKECDVAFFAWCDPYAQMLAEKADEFDCQKIIQCVDLDAWAGHWGTVKWENIDDMVFMSQHIRRMVLGHIEPVWAENGTISPRIHHMPLGIDVSEWKFKDRTKTHKKKMGFVAAEWWSAKNPAMIPMFARKLLDEDPNWEFSWVGAWGPEKWLYHYCMNQIDSLNLREHFHIDLNRQESLDDWWENIDYFVTFSQKDSFSLIVGEAMAKGIKTFAHNFYGAEHIWDEKYIWRSFDELVEKVLDDDYDSREYRRYIVKKKNIKPILKKWDKLITLGPVTK